MYQMTNSFFMIICILSDSHDRHAHLATAVEDAKARGAEAVLHCGDLVAPSILLAAQPFGLPLHIIHGNNMGNTNKLTKLACESEGRIAYYGEDATITLANKKIFIVHLPHLARTMAATGDYDLVCNGHEHRAHIDEVENNRGGKTVLLNPGTVGGISAPATYILGNLNSMTFEIKNVPSCKN